VPNGAPEAEAGMHRPQGRHPIRFRHHTTGADLTGGDQFDVEAGLGQVAEHAARRPGGGGHAGANGAHPGDRRALLQGGAGPLSQQGAEGLVGGGPILPLEREADVATAIGVLPLRLHDRIHADARVGQGRAEGRRGAGPVGHMAHAHLGLVAIEGDTTHLRLAGAGGGGVDLQLPLRQLEGFAGGPQRLAAHGGCDHAAHLHFAGGDQTQVDALPRQGVEQAGGNAGAAHDPSATDAQLAHAALGHQLAAHGVDEFGADPAGILEIRFRHRESDVVAVALVGGLNDQIHIHIAGGEGFEQAGGDAGLIGHMGEGEHGLPFHQLRTIHRTAQFQAFAADRPGTPAGEGRAGFIAPAGAHHQGDAVVAGDLHGAGVEHGGAEAGQFEHLVAADLFHQLGVGHLAWIGGEHAGHVGVDLTDIGAEGGSEGHGGGVGAAAPEGGDFSGAATALTGALKTGHHHHVPITEATAQAIGAHVEDAGPAMGRFGHDAHLGAGHGHRRNAEGMQRHGEQGDRHLFACGEQHVHFPLGRVAAEGPGFGRELIGGVAHRRHHDHQIMPFVAAVGDAAGHRLDALHAADGGAAELLHQQGHPCASCWWRLSH